MTSSHLPGAVQLPDGTWIRGRGLRNPEPTGPKPDFGLYLGGSKLQGKHRIGWPHEWIDWPDFLLPRDTDAAIRAIRAFHDLAKEGKQVEVACGGGIGRTGTVVSCLAILAGTPSAEAIAWARANYNPRAVETPWQRKWVLRFRDRAQVG